MKRSERAFKNSAISFISQISSLLITLITRRFFLQYLGVELLGLNSTFASILNTLSLAELGFETAIIYNLYQPLANRDYKKISVIISVFKRVYYVVAGFMFIASIICLPFLGNIINGVDISAIVYIYFLLQAGNSIVSYLLAYKRTLIYADQKEYISQIYDLICNLIFSVLRIMAIVLLKNFAIYLVLQIGQTALSNLLIHYRCIKLYPEVKNTEFDKEVFLEIFNNVKHVIGSKISMFINTSTDNLVISILIGTIEVGYFTNYTTITSSLKRVVLSVLRPISPIIGGMLSDKKVDNERRETVLRMYSHIGFLFALVILVPTAILLSDFIGVVFGEKFILSNSIVLLIVFDLYIHFVHRATCDYINGAGLFKYDKYIEIIGATINIVISILLAKRLGIVGVLIGTVLSGIFFWIGRSWVVYKFCLEWEVKKYFSFWLHNIYELLVFVVVYVVCNYMYSRFINFNNFVVEFIAGGLVCEIISLVIYMILFAFSKERAQVFEMVQNVFINKFVKKK